MTNHTNETTAREELTQAMRDANAAYCSVQGVIRRADRNGPAYELLQTVSDQLAQAADQLDVAWEIATGHGVCWCGAEATIVNTATDASDVHLACDAHVGSSYTNFGI